MTLLAPSAPLLTIAHDWSSPVERVTTYPSRVLTKWDGTEQRLSLSHLPTERVTYRVIAPTSTDAVALTTLPDLAADALVRVPCWEDQTRVDTSASAGSAVVIACDTTDRASFAVGSPVIFWRSPTSYEVTTLDAVASDSITVDLVSGWAAGTVVAPIAEARLVLPYDLSHWRPTSGALSLTIERTVRDLAGLGTGGTATTGTPATITVTSGILSLGGRTYATARVADAAGNELVRDDIVWTSGAPGAPVHASGDPRTAVITNPASDFYFSFPVTATIGAVSGSATVFMNA